MAFIHLMANSAEKTLEGDKPEFSSCRSLLRYGPAASLRVNIRAVSQVIFSLIGEKYFHFILVSFGDFFPFYSYYHVP